MQLDASLADWFERNEKDDDHFTQPGELFRNVMTDTDRKDVISNIVGAMSGITYPKKYEIIIRQLCHWFRADVDLGKGVAAGLAIKVDEKMLASG